MPRTSLPALIPLLAVVAIAGCTNPFGGSGAATGPGVVITGWEPELANVFSNDQVDLLLKVENQGESRANNVVAELINIDTAEWGSIGFDASKQLGDLIPVDPVTGTPGETKTVQFQNLKAPLLPKGETFTFNPTVRVSYDYATTALKPITIVDADELVKIQQQGKTLPSKPTAYTSGPLSVEIIMGNFVKTSSQFGGFAQQYDIFPVHIQIRNTLWGSGGSVIPKGFGGGSASNFVFGDADYPVRVTIQPPAGTSFVFSGFGDDCSSFEFTVELFRGEEAEITCELQVISAPQFLTESLIQVELDYRFFSDRVTQVTVQGTKETGSLF
ncbi:MAG: hypothetical protein HY369_03310 [Candidatus Aenigmarchaeota archaeon]|nr:hypothetical protein [Candidatus Aenigmarchaeota archaeon]